MLELFIVVGPSGAGKDTLLAGAAARRGDVHIARRVITRPRDDASEDHQPADEAEFHARREAGEFAVWWRAHGLYYGVPHAEIRQDGILLVNGSRSALGEILRAFPNAKVILVTAPDAVLASRLAARGRESAAGIARRLERAGFDIPDEVRPLMVVNDGTPREGIDRFLAILQPVSA
ncbi:MAG: phosphonate metabolism protein/1,5-bisphosphokinase (PRPP-forming) PhnN [Rhodobiaceae bacterium]|nr:phosphonate metabolism protein/1,5-bisphosphokinase (PRPP-forming) PhnN [Rhodobiaceae bacterium]